MLAKSIRAEAPGLATTCRSPTVVHTRLPIRERKNAMSNSPAPPTGLVWSLAAFFIIMATAVPALIYANTDGKARSTVLLVWIGVELILAVSVGLYFRLRGR
ncbi:hypothetical protein JOL79_31680 [Microbispora sp. RL4-1S]|uniref:Uncharacterized protein n=1 Tax=Microbispora oryzae TaxID=2806554 RepID=A0A940WME8_9ACTN|nr:hypothetical protein [Microbispora oryzae]MBP2708349.1 hypothetical protein [Microbispora oryzae]